MKEQLIELYEESMLLSKYVNLEYATSGALKGMAPGKELHDLTEEELVQVITAVVTAMTSQVC